jgi:galactokinase
MLLCPVLWQVTECRFAFRNPQLLVNINYSVDELMTDLNSNLPELKSTVLIYATQKRSKIVRRQFTARLNQVTATVRSVSVGVTQYQQKRQT